MSDRTKTFWQYILFSTNHLETHAICSIINTIYSKKRMVSNNKWKILTPLKFFYTSNYSLVKHHSRAQTAESTIQKEKIFNLWRRWFLQQHEAGVDTTGESQCKHSMHGRANIRKSISQDTTGDLQKILKLILPFIMRLFLSKNITDKIECFVKIGKVLNLEEIVDSMLQSLYMSSIVNNSQWILT